MILCVSCECNDVETNGFSMRWGQKWPKYRCRECGKEWGTAPNMPPADAEPATVTFRKIKCPHCDSEETRITSTCRPKRYHRCEACGQNFNSLEE